MPTGDGNKQGWEVVWHTLWLQSLPSAITYSWLMLLWDLSFHRLLLSRHNHLTNSSLLFTVVLHIIFLTDFYFRGAHIHCSVLIRLICIASRIYIVFARLSACNLKLREMKSMGILCILYILCSYFQSCHKGTNLHARERGNLL